MKMLDFSVVIPARNAEKTIGKSIESVLEQAYPKQKYETLVVDNNSTDNTAELIKQCPVKYLLQKKRGAAAARNLGIKNSKGKIIAFVDSDRFADRNWLKEAKKEFDKGNADLIAGKVMPKEGISLIRKIILDMAMNQQFFVEKGYAATCNLFAKREAFSKVGVFDEKLWLACEDTEWGLRAKSKGYKLHYLDKAMVHYNSRNFLGQMKKEFRRGRAITHLKKREQQKPYLKKASSFESSIKLLKRTIGINNALWAPIIILVGGTLKLSCTAGQLFEMFRP